ncbi:MAG: glycosyltransferase family 2 protein, partial [Clostridia bacterium]|nr:glycosyltransferase family 2 protein [Clostridia bacterium]
MNKIQDNTASSLVRQYFDGLAEEVGRENLEKFLNGKIKYSENAPFLSVIMRTRGDRPEALSEVLLCLSGQSDLDFEVLIMGHNLSDEGRESVNSIIGNLPDYMDGKVRLVEVTGGNRTTPLSRGFEAAKGRYISILDDDDLVFDNWVEAFHSLEKDNAGKIFHSYCAAQDWKVTENSEGQKILTSISGFRTVYCSPFEMVEQLSVNHCPTFSLAFPSFVYNVLNIRFDESLTTTEDW